MQFSRRTAWDTSEGALAQAVRQARAAGQTLVDMTVSNPTMCGFTYDPSLLDGLSNLASLQYDPDPRGLLSARQAVAGYYAAHDAEIDPGDLILTTSTSEAYSFLFRLLCDAGDSVLVAQPSYPLFDFLANLDDIRLEPYPLFYDFGWWIDFAELERRITSRTRAILLVHPNNPTGHVTSAVERKRLQSLSAERGLALIVDEVFLDYGLAETVASFAPGPQPCLTFVVSGISKIAALPQMKVGWLLALGPESLRREALGRLEIVADTYLSMNAPVQHALPGWLAAHERMNAQVRARLQGNLQVLEEFGGSSIELLPVHAGWSAVIRLPQHLASESLGERLVREAGVVVHPGSFYGFHQAHFLVLSLLVPREEFALGVAKLKIWCESNKLTLDDPASSGE
jgi:alanine-synthesizing transaminase